jgi:apolipoprotein N-acyltransferase
VGATALPAGALTAAAFPPYELLPVGLVGLLAGLWVWRSASCRLAAAVRGLLFGLGLFGTLLMWSTRFGMAAYMGLTLSQALFPAVAWALVGGRRLPGGRWWVAAAGGWVLAELARSRWPLGGFEWGQLGHTAGDLPLTAAAAAVGSIGVSGVIVGLGAATVVTVQLGDCSTRRLTPLALAAVVALGLSGVGSVPWTQPAGELTVGIVQADPPCPERPAVDCPRQQELLLERFVDGTRQLDERVDVLLWGEGALDGLHPAEAGAEVRDRTGALPAPLLAGVTTHAGVGRFYNRNVLFDMEGTVVASYAKRHPVPFGEYVPARSLLAPVGDVGRLVPSDMVRGTEVGRIPTPAGPVGTVSSWELSIAREVRDAGGAGNAVVTLTSQASYGTDPVSDQLLAIARLRARELQKSMVVAATTGQSTVIGPRGELTQRTRLFAADSLVATVPLRAGATPYGRTGDWPVALLATGLILTAGAPRGVALPRRRRAR